MLQKINIQPGFNKQVTATGGEGQWVSGDYVRFRYGTPEKIGGWAQLGDSTLTGRNTALHHFVNASGIKYAAIGTNRFLYVYSGGAFYDITPIKATTTLTNAFTTTQSDATVTITFASDHNISKYDIIRLDNFTAITNSNFSSGDFDDVNFMVTTVPTATTLTIEMGSNESGSGASTSGGIRVQHFYSIGPAVEESAAGWGLGLWGGTVAGEITDTLDGALTSGSSSIVLDNSASMPASGTVLIDSERIAYTTNTTGTGTLSGLTRGSDNTTAASHSDGATVTDASDYTKWGASQTGDIVTAPGLWSLDNFGNKLIATIFDGATFEWDSDATGATSTRATIIANCPTASMQTLVSTPDRHLICFGTETTIGTTSTQDDMYIRWSDQESINATTSWTPSATNTAGTQRLADGTRIVAAIRGRDAIYVWTDTSLFIMRFVGAPFVFSFQQVGTNCGLIGKNAAVEVDGSAYWMSENGFFRYTGKLESLACLVEDYVYDDINTVPKQHIYAGLNNLFGEVTWFYPGSGAASNNRSVTYNYMDSTPERPVWTTSTLARSTWSDSHIFGKPHATEYDSSATSDTTVGNTDGVTVYYEHETGVNQIKAGASTAIAASIESGDFDISRTQGGGADLRGDGEYIMKIRRVLPDFLQQTGDARVTLNLKNYPTDSQASSSLGPFTTTTSTDKIDTRARARAISLKVDNTSTGQHWKLGTFRLDIQADGEKVMATTFTPNIQNVLGQTNNFRVPLSSSPYQALGTWEKEGGLQSIYDEYAKATNIAGDWVDKTYNPTNLYKTEGLLGDVRHVVGSSMAKDQLQNLLGDYITPGSPFAEKLTSGLGMFKTYGEEIDDAFRIGKDTIKAGDWDKIWSGEFLTHPLEDIAMNKIGLSIPYGSTEWERLSNVPGIKNDPRFRFKQQHFMNRKKQQMQETIRQAEAAEAAKQKAAADAAAAAKAKADAAAAQQVQQNIQTYGNQDRPNTGMNAPGGGKGQSPTGGDVSGTPFNSGGLVNFYRYGGFI